MPNSRYFKRLSEKGRRLANIRWERERHRIESEMPARIREMEYLEAIGESGIKAGDYIGTLQWHGSDGQVRRWSIFQAARKNQIQIRGIDTAKTWTFLLDRLRRHLSCYTR